jgi:riboflavin synthase
MFTGLVEEVGTLVDRQPMAGGVRLRIATALAPDLKAGDSVAVNGVCLTAVEIAGGTMTADAGPETLRVTTLGALAPGQRVNLERPMRADGRLGGHFVQGHVDAVAAIDRLEPAREFVWLGVSYPSGLDAYLVPKGSIAVDGISLTIAALHAGRFDVQIVPFTLAHTNLSAAHVGDAVNLECDMVGKYVARALELAGLTGPRP